MSGTLLNFILPYEYIFLPTSRKVLSTFRKYCPVGVQVAQTTVGHFAHFQVQARMAVCHEVTVPVSLHAVELLHTATFHWFLEVATPCCIVVHLCSIPDQPDTTEISQIQLAPAVILDGGGLGCYWGPTARRALCTFQVSPGSPNTTCRCSREFSYRKLRYHAPASNHMGDYN